MNATIAIRLLIATAVATVPLRSAAAQVQIRLPDATHATYSELHEGLRPGTPAADSVRRILGASQPAAVWAMARAGISGKAPWNEALLALTRLAELPPSAFTDSAAALARAIEAGSATVRGGDPSDLLEPINAVVLARRRQQIGDAKLRDELVAKVPARAYGLGDAWTLGRLGAATGDTLAARFLAATGEEAKVRWLTLMSFSRDTALVPVLARIYVAPDSFGVPVRYGIRASDGLLWIGTRAALQALQSARAAARARGVYADPRLMRGGYDFLANDSSAVISRTGKWLDAWIAELQ